MFIWLRFMEFNFFFVNFNVIFPERQYSTAGKSINSEVNVVKIQILALSLYKLGKKYIFPVPQFPC